MCVCVKKIERERERESACVFAQSNIFLIEKVDWIFIKKKKKKTKKWGGGYEMSMTCRRYH